ncbi:GNAT family N-acetyltransferase [Microbacteriaceae bacterium 4G12]
MDEIIASKRGKYMSISLKALNKLDIEKIVNLSHSVGWDYDQHEIQTVLDSGNIYGHINEHDELLSSAAIIPYGQDLASIGMVIVNPQYRGLGLGKSVVEACINSITSNTPIMLISTDEGKPMYEKLGFQTVSSVHKYLCDHYITPTSSCLHNQYDIGFYQDKDFPQIKQLDQEAVGPNREDFLKHRIRQSKRSLVARGTNGDIVGFGLSIQTPANLILGPIVALNDQVATLLIHSLSKNHSGRLRIDISQGKESFIQDLENIGFQKISQPPVMLLHADKLPPRNNTLYGIAAQIFG